MPIILSSRIEQRSVIVQVRGDLGKPEECRDFRQTVLQSLSEEPKVVLIDFSELTSLNACGIESTLAASFMARHRGKFLQVFGASEAAQAQFLSDDSDLVAKGSSLEEVVSSSRQAYQAETGAAPFDILEFVREEEGRGQDGDRGQDRGRMENEDRGEEAAAEKVGEAER